MNREIKFRAWDNVTEQMHQGEQEQFDDMLGFRFNHFETDSPIYMQFTGMHDKNGKEIYEGDIIIFKDWKPKIIVYQDKSFAGFSLKNTDLFLSNYDSEQMIIIGNIYENPELIEASDEQVD